MGAPGDITVISVAELPRPFTAAEQPRSFTVTGGAMNLPRAGREYYSLRLTTDPPVASWEASFDDGLTWLPGEAVVGDANVWRWLVAGPGFTPADETPTTILAGTIRPLVRATADPEVVIRQVSTILITH